MSQSEISQQPHQHIHASQMLNVFVGKWETQGEQHAGVVGAAAPISAVETYEWLAGGHFLVHRFEGHVGKNEAACIEIIGYDAASGSYLIHTFYSNGMRNEWRLSITEGVWTLTGEWKGAGQSMEVRCTTFFSECGNTMIGNWEYLNDEKIWKTFWDVKARKV